MGSLGESYGQSQGLAAKEMAQSHPLCPLTATEIKESARLIRGKYPAKTDIHFKVITLQEPVKAELVPFLEAEHATKRPLPRLERKAFIAYYIRNTVCTI